MIAALALALAADGTSYADASLELREDLVDHRFVDVDMDGAPELVLAVKLRRGGRELRLHRISGVRVEPEPFARVPVLRDVLAYGFADVRAEPGRELLFLTRGGVHSYSTTREGLRDNVQRLFASELIYDVPDPRALPCWRYVLPGAGGDHVLVPSFEGLELWGPAGEPGSVGYRRRATLQTGSASFRHLPTEEGRTVEAKVEVASDYGMLYHDSFQGDTTPDPVASLGDWRAVTAPALVDVDGDGRLDLVLRESSSLAVYLDRGEGIPVEPTRIEERPEYLKGKGSGGSSEMRLVDLDGDGDRDLLVEQRSGGDGLENAEYTLTVLLHEDGRLFPAEPSQLLRFEAAFLRVDVVDVDRDGRPDLFVRQFELPDVLETVTGLEFELTWLLFLGEARGPRPFGRKPALRRTDRFDEDSVATAAANRDLSMDCDGDGIPDLVEIDLAGYIGIRRMRKESGLFSGESWELDRAPWKRFEVRGDFESLEVLDLNGDGLGDIVSTGERALAILLSMDGRRGRR